MPVIIPFLFFAEAKMGIISVVAQCGGQGNGGQGGGDSGGSLLGLLPPFILMIVVFYFVLIRPQRKKEKERQEMVNAVKKGDRIVTNAGISGSVVSLKDQWVFIKIDENSDTKLKVLRSSIAGFASEYEKEEGKAPDAGGPAK